jgi:hypothetical protein
VQVGGDLPAGFIGRNHGTAADLRDQRVIRRFGLARGATDHMHEATAGDRQAEAFTKQARNLAERHAELLVEDHGPGHRHRPELRAGRAQRIGGLQRMTALHAPMAGRAPDDRDAKLTDDGPARSGDLLDAAGRARSVRASRHSRDTWPAAARRSARRRAPAVVGAPIDRRLPLACDPGSGAADAACRARTSRLGDAVVGGLVEVVFEPIDLLAELVAVAPISIPIALHTLMLASQPLVLALQSLEFGDQFLAGGRVPSRVHAPVMTRLENRYKYKR